MDDTPATPQPKRPRRAETVSKMPAPKLPKRKVAAGAKASANGAAIGAAASAAAAGGAASEPAPVEAKQGFVVLQGESMPAAQVASLEVRQGAIGRVDATDVNVSQGALGGARADHVSVSQGALGGALAGELSVSQSGVGTVVAREARIEQSFVGRLVAQEARFEKPSAVVFMLAQRVSGDIRVLFDWKSALALGGAIGLVSGLVRRIARRKG